MSIQHRVLVYHLQLNTYASVFLFSFSFNTWVAIIFLFLIHEKEFDGYHECE